MAKALEWLKMTGALETRRASSIVSGETCARSTSIPSRFISRTTCRPNSVSPFPSAKAQVSFPVCYKGQHVGEYAADLVVEEKVIVELKCVEHFANEHLAQCINYLKASGLRVALLINFQKPAVSRNM